MLLLFSYKDTKKSDKNQKGSVKNYSSSQNGEKNNATTLDLSEKVCIFAAGYRTCAVSKKLFILLQIIWS